MSGGLAQADAKQFLSIGGVPVLIHSLLAFASVPRLERIYVAVRPPEIERVAALVADYGLSAKVVVLAGGDHRQNSVSRALANLDCADDDVILVHDAVRPLIDLATINRTISAILRHGAAIVGLPAVDTIKQVERTADGAIITSTIPRERVVHAQTPQGALAFLLKQAFREADADEFAGTDEASLLERAGIQVAVVAGLARNFKVTQPGDLELAEFYLSRVPVEVR